MEQENRGFCFATYFKTLNTSVCAIEPDMLTQSAKMLREVHEQGGTAFLVGNGGSASIANHVSLDLTHAAGIRAINFNEAGIITCFANDYGYERWVEKGIEYYGTNRDIAVLISSSGRSNNIVNGALKSKALGMKLITLSGFHPDNPLRQIGDINLWVNSATYNIIEMTHQIWLLAIVDKLVNDRHQEGSA